MTTQMPRLELNDLINHNADGWTGMNMVHGVRSPFHQVLSQIKAVVGDSTESIRYVTGNINPSRDLHDLTLSLVLFTDDLVLRSRFGAGEEPTLRVFSRSSISDVVVLFAPVGTDSEFRPAVIKISYPSEDLTLPLTTYEPSTEAFRALVKSLVDDLVAKNH